MQNTNDILLTISRLRDSLNEVESAKNQVQAIIDVYEPMGKNLSEYTEQLFKVHGEIANVISSLNSQLSGFEEKTERTIEIIKTECKSIIDDSNSFIFNADILLKRSGKQFELGCEKNNELFSSSTAILIEQTQEKIDRGVSNIGETIVSLEKLVSDMYKVKLEIGVALEPIKALANRIEMFETRLDKNYIQHSKDLMDLSNKLDNGSFIQSENAKSQTLILNKRHSAQDIFQTNLNESLNKIQEQLNRSEEKSKIHTYISIVSLAVVIIVFSLL